MGEVWRATDTRLGRDVALKLLPEAFARDPDRLARFEREARAVAALSHPNVLALFDVGTHEGAAYAATELLEGETLRARLARGALPIARVIDYAQQIALGLAAAHEKGIVHRDLKPENLFVTHDGRVKILDFGLARLGPAAPAATDSLSLTLERHTEPGTVLGTAGYMSPEQVRGGDADARSDVFSFGAVVYEMLTGRRAFSAGSAVETMNAVLKEDPPPPSSLREGVPATLESIVQHCLEKEAGDRFQSARDLAFDLGLAAGSGRVAPAVPPAGRGRRRVLVGMALAVLAVGAALAAWWAASGRTAGPPVIVLMDSTHPERVYDPETRKAGGTNADDLTDLLRDLPVRLVKENTSATWHREDAVVREDPDLVVVHRSCFYDVTFLGDPALGPPIYPLAADKFEMFVGYVGLASPRTRFLVYSRRSWDDDAARDRWVADLEKRFQALRGRVRAWRVPLDRPTFRNPQTGAEIRREVEQMLALGPAPP